MKSGRLRTFITAGLASAAMLGVGASPAFAVDGTVTGAVSKLDMTEATNLAFRVYLSGSPAMCGNANTWAYVEVSDTNYQGYVSFVMSAWMANKTLTIYSNRDASGYCQIIYITAQ
jgi:hypothetical protein